MALPFNTKVIKLGAKVGSTNLRWRNTEPRAERDDMFEFGGASFARDEHGNITRSRRRMELDSQPCMHLCREQIPVRVINESCGHGYWYLS
jgi:hypothetical protein